MKIIGDIHGKLSDYLKLIENESESIQLGDFGIGLDITEIPNINLNHKFIRGNHDNPEMCKLSPNYLGDFGLYKDIFFISGALSVDWAQRTEGIDFWNNEELSYSQFCEMINLYNQIKPEIVISHDCPMSVKEVMVKGTVNPTRTNQALEVCFQSHQPKLWIFGHHHFSFNQIMNGTQFICLKELETLDL